MTVLSVIEVSSSIKPEHSANGLGRKTMLCTPHDLYNALGGNVEQRASSYRKLFKGHLDAEFIDRFRIASNKGMAIGSDRFKDEIELLTGRRVRPNKRGPKLLVCP